MWEVKREGWGGSGGGGGRVGDQRWVINLLFRCIGLFGS